MNTSLYAFIQCNCRLVQNMLHSLQLDLPGSKVIESIYSCTFPHPRDSTHTISSRTKQWSGGNVKHEYIPHSSECMINIKVGIFLCFCHSVGHEMGKSTFSHRTYTYIPTFYVIRVTAVQTPQVDSGHKCIENSSPKCRKIATTLQYVVHTGRRMPL